MSRQARQLSNTGLYHIMFNGISKQNLFEEPADYEKLKEIIENVKSQMQFKLYAYCFMTNHVHLFIQEDSTGDISKIMSKILSHYATWYNIKYTRSGTLFSNRFKSEPVEDDNYVLALIRYIHQNPIKANITNKLSKYPYSSYNEYATGSKGIVDKEFFMNMLDQDKNDALIKFAELHTTVGDDDFEITDSRKKTDYFIKRLITTETGGISPENIKAMNKMARNEIIKKLVTEKGISKSALERITGISRGTIAKICETAKSRQTGTKTRIVPFFLD